MASTKSDDSPPFLISILVAWGPYIVMIFLYLSFLKLMRELIEKIDRIGASIEKLNVVEVQKEITKPE